MVFDICIRTVYAVWIFLCDHFAWYSLILYMSQTDPTAPYLLALFGLEATLNLLSTQLACNRILLKMSGTHRAAWRETSDFGGYHAHQSCGSLQTVTAIHL